MLARRKALLGAAAAAAITMALGLATSASADMAHHHVAELGLVDHALSRVNRGLVGKLIVEGPEQPDIFREGVDAKLGLLAE